MAPTNTQTMKSNRLHQRDAQMNREQWISYYAERIFKIWKGHQTKLGVAAEYIQHIVQDLSRQYENPLQRMLIEATY
jgi:hypothetical protein